MQSPAMDEERVRAIVKEELSLFFSRTPSMNCPVARMPLPPVLRSGIGIGLPSRDDSGSEGESEGDGLSLFGDVEEY